MPYACGAIPPHQNPQKPPGTTRNIRSYTAVPFFVLVAFRLATSTDRLRPVRIGQLPTVFHQRRAIHEQAFIPFDRCLAADRCTSAFAASSTDLTVTGIITPTACTPALSNNGTVDFGKRSAKDLNQTRTFCTESSKLNVVCDGETTFALELADNRSTSTISPYLYGLGRNQRQREAGRL